MKIGIYGDSFTNHQVVDPLIDNKFISWVDLLKKKYTITNFGKQGTSIFYSYQMFQKTHKLFDKVIVSFSMPVERLMLPKPILKLKNGAFAQHIIFKNILSPDEYDMSDVYTSTIVNALSKYYLYCYNLDFYNESFKLMKEEIIRQRSDGLFVADDLIRIYKIENEYYNISIDQLLDRRTCHLTSKNNFLFAEIVSEWITNNIYEFNKDKFIPNEDYNYYFK